jgi:hypothetical protein
MVTEYLPKVKILSHFSVDELCDIWWSEEFLLAMLSHKLLVIGA